MSTLPPDASSSLCGLSLAERDAIMPIRHLQRRREFIAARRLAKSLLARHELLADHPPAERITILPHTGGPSQRPCITVDREPQPLDISITHASGWVAVAIATEHRIGIDLVAPREVRADRLAAWMTPAERELAAVESLHLAELWAMKEAAYKATNENEPFRPADFPVVADRGWTCGGCSILLLPMGRLTLALATADPALFRDPTKFYFERRRV